MKHRFDTDRGLYVPERLQGRSPLRLLSGPAFFGGINTGTFLSLGLHFAGSNASTTFTEATGKTPTVGGNAQISTAQYKFDASSGLFDGSGDYVSFATHATLNLDTQDFGIGCFFRTSANPGAYQWLISKGASGGSQFSYGLGINPSNKLYGFASFTSNISSFVDATGTTSVNDTTWRYAFFGRSGSNFRLALDGTQEGSTATSSTAVYGATSRVAVGASFNTSSGNIYDQFYNGYIDDATIYRGYYPGLTVPTVEFANP